MRLAFWPGLGGGTEALIEVAPVLGVRGIDSTVVDPRYGDRRDWSLGSLAEELAATEADMYAGHSWGAGIAVVAAALRAPRALVLLDGGHVAPTDFPAFGGEANPERRIEQVRAEHDSFRWSSREEYLEWVRAESRRWNPHIERAALEGLREESGEVLPPLDTDTLEAILRGYEAYDAVGALEQLPRGIPVLLVAPFGDAELDEARDQFVDRFRKHVPDADVERVEAGHDVIFDLGPPLGDLVADWVYRRVAS